MALFLNYPSWIKPEVVPFLPIRWYAVMYLVAFFIAYLLFKKQLKTETEITVSADDAESLFLWVIVGLLIGARLFSVLFYNDAAYYITHFWLIFWPFDNGRFVGLPGMSYHGGLFGGILGGLIYSRRKKLPFLRLTDMIVASVPLGYTFGRLGNFINGELYGRVSTLPFAMVFPDAPYFSTSNLWVRNIADSLGIAYKAGDLINLPRHPSQLYEALFEGVVLFFVLWFVIKPLIRKHKWADGTMLGSYLIGYGLVRFFIEYCRQPDSDIGYVLACGRESNNIALFQSFLNISKGQIFCLLMIICGIAVLILCNKGCFDGNKRKTETVKKKTGR
jgi:prolipoprotein diacylglyceryl transferase